MEIMLTASLAIPVIYRPATLEQAEERYGKLYLDYSWQNRSKWITKIDFKEWGLSFKVGYINKDMMLPLTTVLDELRTEGLLGELRGFQGCYNPRAIKNTIRPSTHAYGLACDFNNGPFSEEFVEVWERSGFCWGGHFSKPDPMHFSFGWECKPK
jgi:hypothetical protein